MSKIVLNDLFDYENRFIYQDEDNFKFSLDSILLAEFVEVSSSKQKILDLCTGNAPIPLILSTKYKNEIIGFEIQKEIHELAIKSIYKNNCENQIKIINDDLKNVGNYFPGNIFDIITCNPPYFKHENSSLINKNSAKSIARHEIYTNLAEVIQIAANNLNNKGSFYLVHRATRIDEIINLCLNNNLAVKELQLITTNKDANPSIVLIRAVKNGKNGVKINKIVDISGANTFKNIFKRGE